MIQKHEEQDSSEYWKPPVYYYDDDDNFYRESIDETQPSDAITPDLPITDSLVIEDEHLDTIPETDSDEEIDSSVENLNRTPSESEDLSNYVSECDLPFCDNSPDFNNDSDIFSNPLFDSNADYTSSDDESSSEEDVLVENLKIYLNPLLEFDEEIFFSEINQLYNEVLEDLDSIPPGIVETNFDPKEDIRLIKKLLYDNSSPRPPEELNSEISDAIIEYFSSSPIPVKDKDNLLLEYELDLGKLTRVVVEDIFGEPRVHMPNVLPTHPTLCQDLDFTLSTDFSGFDLIVSFPFRNRNKTFDPRISIEFQSKRFLLLNKFSISFISDPLSPVLETLLPFLSEIEDKVFNPRILVSKEEKSPHLLSYRGKEGKNHLTYGHSQGTSEKISWNGRCKRNLEELGLRFGGNANSKKMQKDVLKQQFKAFTISSLEGLEKGYDRFQQLLSQLEAHGAEVSTEDANHKFLKSLPPTWSNLAMTMRTKLDVDTLSINDLYNNLRVFKQELTSTSKSSVSAQNVAFVSHSKSSTNKVKSGHTGGAPTSYYYSFYFLFKQIPEESYCCTRREVDDKSALMAISQIMRRIGMKAVKEKEQLQKTVDSWKDSSKNLWKLVDSGMSSTSKVGLGRKNFIDNLLYIRFQRTYSFKNELPILLTGDYTPKPQQEIDESLYVHVVSEPKPTEVEPSCVTHLKTPRKPMENQETPKVNGKNWNEMMERELGEGYSFIKKKCFVCGSLSHLIRNCNFYEKKMAREAELKKQRVFNTGNGVAKLVWNNANRVNHANHFVPRPVQLIAVRQNVNSVRPNVNTGRANVNSVRQNVNSVRSNVNTGSFNINTVKTKQQYLPGHWGTAVKTSAGYNWRRTRPNSNYSSGSNFVRTDHPLKNMEDRGIFDSGCSGHMTGNKDYLDDFEECKEGSVTFGGSKGYITGKGRIRVGNLDFDSVSFVKELEHFNLFSISQICDKQHKVLFTETKCLVVSPDSKMPDENQILLKVPRQHNMYSFDMKTPSLTKYYACLIAKATSDESKL
ncbi:hypothetical protein Tco_0722743 [Tanacetum coccineum]